MSRKRYGPVLTLGDMRAHQMNALLVRCRECNATRVVDVSIMPDEVLLIWFPPKMQCRKCSKGDPVVSPYNSAA